MRLSRSIAAAALLLTLPAVGLAAPATASAGAQAPRAWDPAYSRATAPWGPDVSGWQHPAGAAINWAKVRASGATFANIKVSEGTNYASPWFRTDAAAARAQGLYVAGYHFTRPRLPLSTAVTEANFFADRLGDIRGRGWLPAVADIEMTGGLSPANVTAWERSFVQTLESRTRRTPIIYSGWWFWAGAGYMNNPTGFARYPLWDAAYNSNSTPGPLFGDWTRTSFWQYTDQASIPGIIGNSDNSFFHGSRADLAALANAGPPSVPPIVSPVGPALSLGVAATSLPSGNPDFMLGRLTNSGKAVAGAPVSLWAWRVGNAGPTKLWTAATRADGTLFFADRPTRLTLYALRVEPGAMFSGSPRVLSPGVLVQVH